MNCWETRLKKLEYLCSSTTGAPSASGMIIDAIVPADTVPAASERESQ